MQRNIKITILAVSLILASVVLASAEVRPGAMTLSPMVGYQWFDGDLELDDAASYGLGIGYNAGTNVGLELDVRYSPTEPEFSGGPDVRVWTATVNLLYHFQPEQDFVPYLLAGLGGMVYDLDEYSDDEDWILNWGGGFKYALSDAVDLRVDVRHVLDFRTDNEFSEQDDDVMNNVSAAVGLNFQFGGASQQPVKISR